MAEADGLVGDKPDDADREDAGEDFRRFPVAPRRPQLVADAGIRGDDLRHDQISPAPAERDTKAVHHVRKHRTEEDVLEQRAIVGAKRQTGFDVLLWNAARVVGDKQHQLEERADPKKRDLRFFADAEPDHRERHQCGNRQIANEIDERLGGCSDDAIARHQHAERDRDHRGREEGYPDARDAYADVIDVAGSPKQPKPGADDRPRGRKELRLHQTGLRNRPPNRQHEHEGANSDPELDVGVRLAAKDEKLAQPASPSRNRGAAGRCAGRRSSSILRTLRR